MVVNIITQYILFRKYYYSCVHSYCLVSGEANFTMHHTGLTVGGITQPSVARNMLELEHQANIKKAHCQCFLWLVPMPNNNLLKNLPHAAFTATGKYELTVTVTKLIFPTVWL